MIKNISLLLLLSISLFLIGCQASSEKPGYHDGALDFEAQYIRTDGYIEEGFYPVITLINSPAELNEYYNARKDDYDFERREQVASDSTMGFLDAIDAYDAAYFTDHVLVFVLVREGSGSNRHAVKSIKENGGLVEMTIEQIVPDTGTDDMAEWHIMVELKRGTFEESDLRVILE